ncbi:1,4-alpha-d-glucan glucohydrolase [Hyphopichia burtonii NRRL Y-1933]|uniref:Glucoamylase 1 n=1 Tax=Hyphopichia burtonii NRRL Y-1933 TaxID=984485 RepID=A0A1E4RD14_9ASCO|nr:1,4-alpha-d-glucan glucohydrolase [Hyphopichia burtonii NRRL Y-1933]ODV65159.1 1,4-alpha-d-glucan glucohydrolase [Hyphopichia burtonii NRRL Y-1933]
MLVPRIVTLLVAALAANAAPASESASSADSQITLDTELTLGVKQTPNIENDTAVDANQVAKGYDLVNVSSTARGLTGILKLKEATNLYGYDFDYLNLSVSYQSDERLNVHIEPVDLTDVYVLPEDLVPKPSVEGDVNSFDFDNSDLVFQYSAEDFSFEIIRQSTKESLFSTKGNPLVFSNQFIQFNTSLPKDHYITGLGESIHGFRQEPGVVKTLFANDVGDPIDGNIYGVHPFYSDQRYDTKTTHGVYWRTSAPQEVLIEEESLTWRALNGVIDLYFFSGDTPKKVISQYVNEIGLPAFQSYWTFGYHQCRWGYDSVDELQSVIDNFKKFNIPLETIWSDIDYMDSYKDFTNDPHRYPKEDFKKFIESLHENNQHYVPIVDAAIYAPNPNNQTDNDYPPFHDGIDSDVFLKNPDGSLYVGSVWPGYTVFPDFLANDTQDYWQKCFEDWYKDVPFDGIWLDMNEVSSFCVGSCGSGKLEENPVHPPFAVGDVPTKYPEGFEKTNASEYSSVQASISATASSSASSSSASSTSIDSKNTLAPGKGNINYPPYAINHFQGDHDLATHAVSPNATHQDGTLEYDIHNLYGYTQEVATHKVLLEINPNKRPFILSRSTFPGSGKYTTHWGGDNNSQFRDAYFSIPQILSLQMFGIGMIGPDTCGFNGQSSMELCSRWMQLSSFFPFFRNHNVLSANPQEPYVWSSVTDHSKQTINIRYLLLPYFYTNHYDTHTTGTPLMRALSWEFPNDRSLAGADRQFFVGDAILVTPVLTQGADTVKGVFPGAGKDEVYYDWYTYEKQDFEDGKNTTLDAPLGHIPLHIRGGYVIPTQEPGYTTAESRENPWGLIVALGVDKSAQGKLYVDDGESYEIEESLYVNFVAANNTLLSSSFGSYDASQPLANVTILGVDSKPKNVKFDGNSVDFSYENSTLFVTNLEQQTSDGAFAKQWKLTWN